MLGFDAPYVPGWDCHGLPIEWKIEEQYRAKGKDKDEVPVLQFRAECRAFAEHWKNVQSEEFQRLGRDRRLGAPLQTMTKKAEAQILREIYKFLLNGLLYKGVKPVMWSVVEKTALAEAEIEYQDHKSTTLWVKFPVIKTREQGTWKAPASSSGRRRRGPFPAIARSLMGISSMRLFEVGEVAEGALGQTRRTAVVAEDLARSISGTCKIASVRGTCELKQNDL